MIGSLRGLLMDRSTDGEVLIEVAGVGYRVQMGPTASVAVGEVGAETYVFVHHHIREDAQTLYGFRSARERKAFEALLGAHGVGPSLALAILSVHDPDALALVVADEDLDALCLVPGVGKKTGQRLLVELRGVLDISEDLTPSAAAAPSDTEGSVRADLRNALAGLGYGPEEIRDALRRLPDHGDPSELLRAALQHLAVTG